jgi:hypothetical protein
MNIICGCLHDICLPPLICCRSVCRDYTYITLSADSYLLVHWWWLSSLFLFFFVAANGQTISVSAASFSTSNYVGSANSYRNQTQEQTLESSSVRVQCPTLTLPSRPKTQRPRVPPPSKVSIRHVTVMFLYISAYQS